MRSGGSMLSTSRLSLSASAAIMSVMSSTASRFAVRLPRLAAGDEVFGSLFSQPGEGPDFGEARPSEIRCTSSVGVSKPLASLQVLVAVCSSSPLLREVPPGSFEP